MTTRQSLKNLDRRLLGNASYDISELSDLLFQRSRDFKHFYIYM